MIIEAISVSTGNLKITTLRVQYDNTGVNILTLSLDSTTATDHYLPIHREAPAFVEQATEQQILVTGIKVPTTSFLAPSLSTDVCCEF